MISFIIPVIHPQHVKITCYTDILICLTRTLDNLLDRPGNPTIIVVSHEIPLWLKKKYHQVHFIILKAAIFNFLKDLDGVANSDQTSELDNIPNKYHKYLQMKSQYHNKDKGLKYFIGLLYYYNLPKREKRKFIGLIDGDDFIHKNLGKILNKAKSHMDMFVVQKGYAMFSKSLGKFTDPLTVNLFYELDNFSNVCGSNRFFKSTSLEEKLKRRLRFKIPDQEIVNLIKTKTVNDRLIHFISFNINSHPDAWSILPNFFGIHRLVLSDGISLPHHFMSNFNMVEIPIRASIKFIHTTNHSCDQNNKNIQNEIITRYKNIGLIKPKDNGYKQIREKMSNFGLRNFNTINIIQN